MSWKGERLAGQLANLAARILPHFLMSLETPLRAAILIGAPAALAWAGGGAGWLVLTSVALLCSDSRLIAYYGAIHDRRRGRSSVLAPTLEFIVIPVALLFLVQLGIYDLGLALFTGL